MKCCRILISRRAGALRAWARKRSNNSWRSWRLGGERGVRLSFLNNITARPIRSFIEGCRSICDWVTGPGITIGTIFKIDFRVLNLAHQIAHALAPLAVSEKLPAQFSHRLDVFVFRQTRQHVLAALFGDL